MDRKDGLAIKHTIITTMVILIILFLTGFVSTEITGNPVYYHGATFCSFSAIIIQNFYIMKRIDRDDSVISRKEKWSDSGDKW